MHHLKLIPNESQTRCYLVVEGVAATELRRERLANGHH